MIDAFPALHIRVGNEEKRNSDFGFGTSGRSAADAARIYMGLYTGECEKPESQGGIGNWGLGEVSALMRRRTYMGTLPGNMKYPCKSKCSRLPEPGELSAEQTEGLFNRTRRK